MSTPGQEQMISEKNNPSVYCGVVYWTTIDCHIIAPSASRVMITFQILWGYVRRRCESRGTGAKQGTEVASFSTGTTKQRHKPQRVGKWSTDRGVDVHRSRPGSSGRIPVNNNLAKFWKTSFYTHLTTECCKQFLVHDEMSRQCMRDGRPQFSAKLSTNQDVVCSHSRPAHCVLVILSCLLFVMQFARPYTCILE